MRDYSGPKSLKSLFKVFVQIFDSKQDNIPGVKGQLVGFDDAGKPIAQEPPDTGVTKFKGREGDVEPLAGDYTAQMVGALPITGGTLTGPLIIGRMKISWNSTEQAIDIEVI